MTRRAPAFAVQIVLAVFVGIGIGLSFGYGLGLVATPIWTAANAADKASDWLGFLGNILAFFGTICAAVFAWLAVRQQLHFSIITREEERIDRELPKLQDERRFLDTMTVSLRGVVRPNTVERVLGSCGVPNVNATKTDELERKLPLSDRSRLRLISGLIGQLSLTAFLEIEAQKEVIETMHRISDRRNDGLDTTDLELQLRGERENRELINAELQLHVQDLIAFKASTERRVMVLLDRQSRCRSEIDQFFVQG
jgi:hypothetical protein